MSPTAAVRTGLEEALADPRVFRGKRLGVIANQSSVDRKYRHALDLLLARRGCRVVAAFGPQHGVRGETQDNMVEWRTFRDRRTGLPTYSLYGKTRKPTVAMLRGLDALVFDVQDVGARYYTFIYTMALAMEACAEQDKEMIVLDRPNPLGGVRVEGYMMEEEYRSFVGLHPLPHRHGMSVGELALYFREERGIPCRLQVVPMKGWRRHMWFDQTRLPWVLPSPNMPTLDTAVVYPGMCLLEGTELSEGRGTTRPFEIFGAPFIEPEKLVARLAEFKLPGVKFRPLYFKPAFQKFAAQVCGGAQLHVTRRRAFKPLLTGVAVLKAVHDLYPGQFQFRHRAYEFVDQIPAIDLLMGGDQFRQQLMKGASLKEIEGPWTSQREEFLKLRKEFLLYRN